jgi:hypothetical protein
MIAIAFFQLPTPKRVRHAVTDAALVLSILSGGCMMERPQPDDDDDDDCDKDEACPDEVGSEPDAEDDEPTPYASTPPEGIPGSSEASCCSPHYGVGCQDHTVESCVCGLDPACCTEGWDATCVMTAEQLCQTVCDADDGPWG